MAFFEAAGRTPYPSTFLINFGGLLATISSIIYLESYQRYNSFLIRYSPLITGLLFQSFGAGIILPLWMTLWCILASEFTHSTGEGSNYIRTIFPSVVLGFYLPSAILSSGNLSRYNQQSLSAAWQLFPLWISILQPFIALVLSPFPATSTPTVARNNCLTYLIYLNTLLHYYSLYKTYQLSVIEGTTLLSTLTSTYYISIDQPEYPGTTHLFLLFDYLTVFISSVIFVLFSPTRVKTAAFWKLLFSLIVRVVFTGPGAAVAWGYRAWTGSEKSQKNRE